MPEAEIIETPQPAESKSLDWPKIILAVVLGLALLATAAYAGYWYGTQQTQAPQPKADRPPDETPIPTPTVEDPISGWETYINDLYSYSVKYPPTWYVYDEGTYFGEDKPRDPKRIVFISPAKRGKLYAGGYSIGDALVIQFGIGEYSREGLEADWRKIEDSSIAGASCLRTVAIKEPAMGNPSTEYLCERAGETFLVTFENQDLQGTHNEVFDQILSTFKFLEVGDETGDWKTYTNTKYGFTVQYPFDFYIVGSPESQSVSFGPNQYREVIKDYHAVMAIDSTLTTLNPQQFLDKYGNTHTFSNLREVKNMTIDGSQAIQFTATNKQTSIVATHTLVNAKDESGELLIISRFYVGKNRGEVSDEIYNQILSTFKFLD